MGSDYDSPRFEHFKGGRFNYAKTKEGSLLNLKDRLKKSDYT